MHFYILKIEKIICGIRREKRKTAFFYAGIVMSGDIRGRSAFGIEEASSCDLLGTCSSAIRILLFPDPLTSTSSLYPAL